MKKLCVRESMGQPLFHFNNYPALSRFYFFYFVLGLPTLFLGNLLEEVVIYNYICDKSDGVWLLFLHFWHFLKRHQFNRV